MAKFDPFLSYLSWVLTLGLRDIQIVSIYDCGMVRTLVIDRHPPYQAEVVTVIKGGGFPQEHRHPDVDTYEIGLFGDIPLTINGKPAVPYRYADNFGRQWTINHIGPTDFHGVELLPEGAVFLSIQQWLNGREPTSVGYNWEGLAVDPKHEKQLADPDLHTVWRPQTNGITI